jgi:hypothetical protein
LTTLRWHASEIGTVVATLAVSAIVLLLVDVQIFQEPWAVDPWFYTALTTNFDPIYGWFHDTYYASRLPMIVPGLFLNAFLTPTQAYVVVHLVVYLAGSLFLYLLVRLLFGVGTAVFVLPAYLLNAAYVDSNTSDYFDGWVVTYVAGGLYFLVSSIGSASQVRLGLAGFFFAAAAATNLFATLLVFGAIVAYLIGRLRVEHGVTMGTLALDGASFVLGAGALLVACGAFSRAHGGPALFFMPSVDAAREIDPKVYKLPYSWIWTEPRR